MPNCCPCILITRSDFESIANLAENVHDKDLDIAIRESQQQFIEPLLCESVFDEICLQISEDNLSEVNEQILCYLKDIQVRYAMSIFISIHSLRIVPEGIVMKVTDVSTFVPSEEIRFLAKKWEGWAYNYVKKLKDYLKEQGLNECGECEDDTVSDDYFGVVL